MVISTVFGLNQSVYVDIDGNRFRANVQSVELRKTGIFYKLELVGFEMVVSERGLLRVANKIEELKQSGGN